MNTVNVELLQDIQKGNEDAFTCVVEAYQNQVFNLCYRMLGNRQAAEDAAQETFWRAYQALGRYNPEKSFITWLLSIAAHYCIDQTRKKKLPTFDIDVLPESNIPDHHLNPEKEFGQLEEEKRIQLMLKKLKPKERAVLILKYWYEFSEKEISSILKISVSAVKSRLFRARKEMAVVYKNSLMESAETGGKQYVSPAF